ncbi:ribbon-helix-helix protein, CopG family [Zafaria sp. Z1313]|uniref:ribbon-helix-helix protein, CopG family n=1 Tax=unclassified Zafaria TaxID=2828765 RepID=UPI002E77F794|nr:ribbon-helix-helix protein, CopG family [Zafaria sp. J156]MEE1620904.1 ribbon-helix-helix protein, CopG family [Zafaria sp. J156]
MAINLRIPAELDAELDSLAASAHTSKSALLLEGARLVVEQARRRSAIDAAFNRVVADNAGLLKRLEDA